MPGGGIREAGKVHPRSEIHQFGLSVRVFSGTPRTGTPARASRPARERSSESESERESVCVSVSVREEIDVQKGQSTHETKSTGVQ